MEIEGRLDGGEPDVEWAILVLVGSAISFTGTRQQAQEHMNKYYAHLEGIFQSQGLSFIRKEHVITRRRKEQAA